MDCPTPIVDFVREYNKKNSVRAHMPGHKGRGPLGFEGLDITEIKGADALYEAEGIIAESQRTASQLFGSGMTLYSAEGSSLSIKAMLCLALASFGTEGKRPCILAGRNAHKAFVYGCGLLDIDIEWLMPGGDAPSVCACHIEPGQVEAFLSSHDRPIAVYITSPDYLGGMADIEGISRVCRRHGVPLLVDNAHGAYLRFLTPSRHPLDLGADMCCDSAHKTLPCLTGAGYLHISKGFLGRLAMSPQRAMAVFGSTSPSYLILQSLDECNRYISQNYPQKLAEAAGRVDELRTDLTRLGWQMGQSDPLKLTVFDGAGGLELAERLRQGGVECEFADISCAVMMFTPENPQEDYKKILDVFKSYKPCRDKLIYMPLLPPPEKKMTVRQAMLATSERVGTDKAVGRICADPSVSCPPAVPVVVCGEVITPRAAEVFKEYGINRIDVVL